MSGYWIIAIIAFIIFTVFLTISIVYGKKCVNMDLITVTQIISCVSVIIFLIFMLFAILYPIGAKVKYENMQKRIEYAESLSYETETEKFEHDYILAEADEWIIDVKYSIDKFGIFSRYYSIRDLTN